MKKSLSCSACGAPIYLGSGYRFRGKTYCRKCYGQQLEQAKDEESGIAATFEYAKRIYSVLELSDSAKSAVRKNVADGKTPQDIIETLEYFYKTKGNRAGRPEDMWWVLRDYSNEAKRYKARMGDLAAEAASSSHFPTPPLVVTIKEPKPQAPKYDYDLDKMTCRRK